MTTLATNLRALEAIDPMLVQALKAAPSFAESIHHADDGGVSFRSGGSEGKWVQSRRGPKVEAERLLAQVSLRQKEVLILIGFGAGYAARSALESDSSRSIALLEPNLSLIRTVLEIQDWSKEIAEGRLVFLNTLPTRPLGDALRRQGYSIATFGSSTLAHAYTKGDEQYDREMAALSDAMVKVGVAMQSEFAGQSMYVSNALANTVHYLQSPSLHAFKGMFKGKTALLCGAGPSLTKQLPLLKEHQDSFFVVAVSSALKRVQNAGIRVDATAMVDYSHLSARYFSDLPSYPPLFCQAAAHPMVLDSYQGPKFMAERQEIASVIGSDLMGKGLATRGSTNVSHFAYLALRHFEFSTIIMIGMDQAYSDHISHAPGAPMYDELAASASRFSTLEGQELVGIAGGQATIPAGHDVNGVAIITDPQMNESAITFENFFAQFQETKVVNATEGGRRLRGAEDMPFSEAISLGKKIDLRAFQQGVTSRGESTTLSKGKTRLDAQRTWAQRVEHALAGLEEAYKRVVEGKKSSVEEERSRLSSISAENEALFAQISRFAASDNFERQRALRDVEEAEVSPEERSRLLAEIEYTYLSGLLCAFQRWQEAAKKGAERLHAAIEGKPLRHEHQEQPAIASPRATQTRSIDGYIELSDDPEKRAAFIGDEGYSPLKQAIKALRAQPMIRRIVVNAPQEELLDDLPFDTIVCVEGSNAADIPRRADAERMMAWNSVSTLRGLGMATALALSANPHRILADLGEEIAEFVMVVPDDCGILTETIVASLIDAGRETHWEQAMYLGEGPRGLFPFLWESESLRQVARDGTATQVVFQQTGSFWGRSFAHVPTDVIEIRRSFSLSGSRGRAMTEAVAREAKANDQELSLESVRDLSDALWPVWVGENPQDIELELTTERPFDPHYLPKLTREARASIRMVEKVAEEIGHFGQGVNLTIGGQGDPLLHPEVMAMIALLRPQVQALNLRTFGAREAQLEELARLGIDSVTIRFGAWGEQEYAEINGLDPKEKHFETTATPLIQFANRQVQQGKQLPMIVPEVVKSLAADRNLLSFKDAWWTFATFPHVIGYNTFGGVLKDKSSIKLYPGKRKPCMRANEQLVIFADGSVPLCWQDFDAKEPIGNVLESSIRELWQHERLSALRKAHHKGAWAETNATCQDCNEWYRFG